MTSVMEKERKSIVKTVNKLTKYINGLRRDVNNRRFCYNSVWLNKHLDVDNLDMWEVIDWQQKAEQDIKELLEIYVKYREDLQNRLRGSHFENMRVDPYLIKYINEFIFGLQTKTLIEIINASFGKYYEKLLCKYNDKTRYPKPKVSKLFLFTLTC